MDLRHLGPNGPAVSALGLGCMAMSSVYGPADEQESLATIHQALDAGVTMLDTGDFYGMGHNEMLVGQVLKTRRDRVFVAVKFGAMRDPKGAFVGFDGRPAAVKNFLAYTLKRLGTDHIDMYMPARVDSSVPIEETIGAIAELVKQGYVRHIGLSEASADTIRRAHAVHPITALQIEYSLVSRGIEREILPTLNELGIGMTAYGVLSRGLLSGNWKPTEGDMRTFLPRFSGENLTANMTLVKTLGEIAADLGMTQTQLAIAWVLARGENIVPLIGPRRCTSLAEALGALDVSLSPETMARLDAAIPAGAMAGDRYTADQMAHLDSEKVTAVHG